jgi:hypothetical protein
LAQSRIIALAAVDTAEQAELAGAALMRAGVTVLERGAA